NFWLTAECLKTDVFQMIQHHYQSTPDQQKRSVRRPVLRPRRDKMRLPGTWIKERLEPRLQPRQIDLRGAGEDPSPDQIERLEQEAEERHVQTRIEAAQRADRHDQLDVAAADALARADGVEREAEREPRQEGQKAGEEAVQAAGPGMEDQGD